VKTAEPIGILGGVRIPFARQNTQYVDSSNFDMLTAVLAGVVQRFGLQGERLGEVAAGAVLKHTRDFGATGARILLGAAKQLAQYRKQTGRRARTLVSVCAAGGLGATAILESC